MFVQKIVFFKGIQKISVQFTLISDGSGMTLTKQRDCTLCLEHSISITHIGFVVQIYQIFTETRCDVMICKYVSYV